MIDLDKEFKKFVDNANWDHVIIRNLEPIKCYCINKENGLPSDSCSNCDGTGYKFTEQLTKAKTFFTPRLVSHAQSHEHAITYKNIMVIYLSATEIHSDIQINDRMFEIKTHLNGVPYDPIVRTRQWVITDIYNMNMAGGKREFIKLHAKPVLT